MVGTFPTTPKLIPPSWRLPCCCALLSAVQGILFLSVQISMTGHLSLPLDDSFIHMQYGKQIAEGYYFRYQAHDAVSGGATSFLYPHLIALGHLVGFQGMSLIVWLYGIAWLSCTAVYCFVFRLLHRWASESAAYFGVANLALSGVSAWAFWGGMEIALFSALLLWFLYEWTQPVLKITPLSIAAACLTLTRPEGTIIVVLCFAMLPPLWWFRRVRIEACSWLQGLASIVIPLAAIVGPPLFYKATLGRFGGNSLLAKSLLSNPIMTFPEKVRELASNAAGILVYLNGAAGFNVFSGEYVPPFLFLLACCGLFVLSKTFGWVYATRIAVPLMVVFVALATLEVWALHNYRYITPFLPIGLVLAITGLQWCLQKQFTLQATILVLVALVSLAHFPTWVSRFAQESSAIYQKQFHAARWVSENLPGELPLAINDAGVLAYENSRPVFDLVGLVSNSTTIAYRVGEGALYETMQNLPPDQRPGHAMIFPGWFEEMANRFDIFYRPQIMFPDPFDPTFGKTLYEINWFYTGPEQNPRPLTMQPHWVVKDSLDVADLASEREHGYTIEYEDGVFPDVPNPFRRNFGYHEEVDLKWPGIENEVVNLIPQLWADGSIYDYDIVDAGRRITGSESFTFTSLDPHRPVHLIMRTCDNDGTNERFAYRIAVECNGVFLGEWEISGTPWNWYESVFTIPSKHVTDGQIHLRLKPLGTRYFPHFDSYYYWACQEVDIREDIPYNQQPLPLSF